MYSNSCKKSRDKLWKTIFNGPDYSYIVAKRDGVFNII